MPRNARSSLTGLQGGPPTHHMGIIHDFKLPGDPEICAMSVAVRAEREGDHASLVPTGPFDLAHATAVARAVESAEARLSGCRSVDVDLAQLDRHRRRRRSLAGTASRSAGRGWVPRERC